MLCCPVCETEPARHFRKCGVHDYWRCNACAATCLDPRQLPNGATERRRYRLHCSDPDDARYRVFLSRLATPLLARLPTGLLGLDYGSGPGPAFVVRMATPQLPEILSRQRVTPSESTETATFPTVFNPSSEG